MGGTNSMHAEKRNSHNILVGKTDVKRPLGRPRRRQDNIKIDVIKAG
jgi:hypothetical protein